MRRPRLKRVRETITFLSIMAASLPELGRAAATFVSQIRRGLIAIWRPR